MTPPRALKMYHLLRTSTAHETRGQSWSGDTMEESIALCPAQTIEPLFLQHLPRTGRILESGCGMGRWVFYLRRKGFDVEGIDLSEPALVAAHAYDPNTPIKRDDVLHSSYPDGHFDAAISLGVVEHFEDGPYVALQELHRLLKPGGTLCISVPTQNLMRHLVTNAMKRVYRWLQERRGESFIFEEYRYTRSHFSRILTDAGFEIVTKVPDDFLPPRNMGLAVDFPFLRHPSRKWELNGAGRILRACTAALSPWWTCAGTFWVCRKRATGH